MVDPMKAGNKKRLPLITILIVGVVVVLLLTGGGFAFAASQESHDPFCASCHTQPESTYYDRSTAAQPVDMASFHTTQTVLCIDCHSGQGVTGRVQAELMGAYNAFKFYTGTAVQPAVLKFPIGDQNCLKCHQEVTSQNFTPKEKINVPGARSGGEREGRNNHWHAFLSRWQAASLNAASCVTCHNGHSTAGDPKNGFLNSQNVVAQCNACHQVLRKGGD